MNSCNVLLAWKQAAKGFHHAELQDQHWASLVNKTWMTINNYIFVCLGSYQGLLGSAGSFRRVARHHSNVSIKSLGSSSHDWSTGLGKYSHITCRSFIYHWLAASLPLPSQRWSSYDGLHAPPTLNPGALSFEVSCEALYINITCYDHVRVSDVSYQYHLLFLNQLL